MEDEFQLGLSQVSCNYDSLPLHQLDFYLKFKEWLQYSKANFENLEIVQFVQEGRGALAAKDIQIDEDICSIPLELLITKKTAENSKGVINFLNFFFLFFFLLNLQSWKSSFRKFYSIT